MFAITDDQQVFERAAARFFEEHHPIERVRALARSSADTASVFDPAEWRKAAQLGWISLLVPESAGGGSISENGLADLLIVTALCGTHAAPGPVIACNVVAAALGRWGSAEQQSGPLADIMSGEAVATWSRTSSCTAVRSGDMLVVDGRIRSAESAPDAGYLLARADVSGVGPSHVLLPLDSPGVRLSALNGVDLTRRFWDVVLDDVRVPSDAQLRGAGDGSEQHEALVDVAAVLALGEMAGALHRAFAMTLEWVANRYSFGRPLNSYQEIKHRMADLRTQTEAAEAIALRAAARLGTGQADGRALASAGMTHVGRHAPEAIQDCIQLHGGIGVTFDHDLHLYLRRAVLDAHVYGSPADFARRLGSLVAKGEAA